MTSTLTTDPNLDLVLERTVPVPVELVFTAWTTPELVKKWFAPRPFTTSQCEIDLRPGGIFRTVMTTPEGEDMDGAGCVLEVVENRRFAWTAALGPGFRPQESDLPFTAVIDMEPAGDGTLYRAMAIHGTPDQAQSHKEMGFFEGWGTVLDQLVEVMHAQ
jgi:uncharacterized protein YndB with AHSA1/START domain